MKNKIVLLYPPQTLDTPTLDYNTPVGLLYVGSYLKERGYAVKLIDCLVEEDYEHKIFDEVKNATCIGAYVMSCHIKNLLPILDRIKKEYPLIKVVLGGPHPTLFPGQTAEDSVVDFVVRDEGEETMFELMKAFQEHRNDFSNIRGITYRLNGKIIDNPARPSIDLDTLPFIDWDLCNVKVRNEFTKGKIIRIVTNRGCPYKCAFCIHVVTMNRKMRYRSPQKVLAEIERNLEVYKAHRVGIRDDMHFVNIEQTKEIVHGIIDRKLKITWLGNVRADYFRKGWLDDEFLPVLVKSGLNKLSFGAESGSERILKLLDKEITTTEIIYAVKQMKKYNIIPVIAFLSCIPGETFVDFMKTMKLIRQLHDICPDAWFNGPAMLRPYPGGKLYDICVKEYGYKKPNTFREWAKHDYATEERITWVRNIDFYKYLWISLLYGRNKVTYKQIIKEEGRHLHRMMLKFILKAIWTWRFKTLNYSFPLDYTLYANYYRLKHGSNPDLS